MAERNSYLKTEPRDGSAQKDKTKNTLRSNAKFKGNGNVF